MKRGILASKQCSFICVMAGRCLLLLLFAAATPLCSVTAIGQQVRNDDDLETGPCELETSIEAELKTTGVRLPGFTVTISAEPLTI
jgi:hypothetical protein